MHTHTHTKSERYSLRLDSASKRLIERAAALSQRSINGFILAGAMEKAEAVTREQNALLLNDEDRDRFFHAILHPARPNKALKAALALHDKSVQSDA